MPVRRGRVGGRQGVSVVVGVNLVAKHRKNYEASKKQRTNEARKLDRVHSRGVCSGIGFIDLQMTSQMRCKGCDLG